MPEYTIHQKETATFRKLINDRYSGNIDPGHAGWFARQLGAHVRGNLASFFVWHPEIETNPDTAVFLELYTPQEEICYERDVQEIGFRQFTLEMETVGPFAFCAVEGLPAGNRNRFGAFYQFRVQKIDGEHEIIRDPMAWSLPYGIYAPAELYDIGRVLRDRKDEDYFQNLDLLNVKPDEDRIAPSVNLLEIHPGTSTRQGTLKALGEVFGRVGEKISRDQPLTDYEKNLAGYDAVELMPLDPVIEHPNNHHFWREGAATAEPVRDLSVRLQKPHVFNWGYDVVIFGAAAINPSLLATGRPHELLDLIETLHNFPARPIKVVLDVVYGHADDQAADLLPGAFFAGPGLYGQEIRFDNPMVRAIILELQRRKMNWGFDGIRVDASQDIKRYDNPGQEGICDDTYLEEMSNLEQQAGGVRYKPWMIFEDGRPWPRDDWELASTYRDITGRQEHAFQWAPTIFSYNTPYKYTYWVSKWWRIREILKFGGAWITGYANHDTLRRGSQADPAKVNVNRQLGDSLKTIMQNAYNNPTSTLVMNGFLPGVPMDFLHSLCNTPWSFMRNCDTTYAVKVAAEEALFSYWQITGDEFEDPGNFTELKKTGFTSLTELQRFAMTLLKFIEALENRPAFLAELLNRVDPPFEAGRWTEARLNDYAEAWFSDLYHFCNVEVQSELIDEEKTGFNLQVRNFRLQHPWLRNSFGEEDWLTYRTPVDGSVIYYGYRRSPADDTGLILAANMEGRPVTVDLAKLNLPVDGTQSWSPVLATPGLGPDDANEPFQLKMSQGVIFKSGDD